MASVIETPPPKDLTRCRICKEVIDKPKALSCLHTFCLECLREWSQHNEESVTCPVVSCKKVTLMPSGGVDGLPGNVFVESLIENSPMRSKKVPCVCCEVKDNVVVAKCLDCSGFLCQEGVDVHKKPFLKSHQVIKLEDVKTGKVDLRTMASKKKPTCGKHEGQALWFFCQTCEVLICQICTVVEHQKPEHTYVEFASVVSEHKKDLEELVKHNEVIKTDIEKRIQDVINVRKSICGHMKDIGDGIDHITEQYKRRVEEVCRTEKERLARERADFESKASTELDSVGKGLDLQKEELQTALDMANQVLQNGSDYDIASVYQQVSSVLETNKQICPKTLSTSTKNLPEFSVNPACIPNNFKTIGNLKQATFTTAILEGRFGTKDAKKGPGGLHMVRGIATTSIGDIAIANNLSGICIKVYSISGKYKYSLDMQSTNAWGVATGPDGQLFVTTEAHRYVTVYGSDGHFQSQFAAVPPAGMSSDTEHTALRGITVNSTKGEVFVGEVNKKYISIHSLDGAHCSSIPLKVAPQYITTTRQGSIIVSVNEVNEGVHIFDRSGVLLHTINAPSGVSKWHPGGVCSGLDDDIIVCNRGQPGGIYRFSSSGSYLGCVNKDAECRDMLGGLTFSKDGEQLVVADGAGVVKVFRRE